MPIGSGEMCDEDDESVLECQDSYRGHSILVPLLA